jgi:2-iminoacetate synthase
MEPFIDPSEIWSFLNNAKPDKVRVREIISKSLDKQRLTLQRPLF